VGAFDLAGVVEMVNLHPLLHLGLLKIAHRRQALQTLFKGNQFRNLRVDALNTSWSSFLRFPSLETDRGFERR
jgi:hypothetical protein